jgi:hypothetical protein
MSFCFALWEFVAWLWGLGSGHGVAVAGRGGVPGTTKQGKGTKMGLFEAFQSIPKHNALKLFKKMLPEPLF